MSQQYCYEPYVIQSSLSHQTVAYSPYFTTNTTPLFSPAPFIVQVPSLPLSLTLTLSLRVYCQKCNLLLLSKHKYCGLQSLIKQSHSMIVGRFRRKQAIRPDRLHSEQLHVVEMPDEEEQHTASAPWIIMQFKHCFYIHLFPTSVSCCI